MSGDPTRPAYDNPTGNKGALDDRAKAHPQERPRKGRRSDAPIGHASDGKLGQKPAKD